MYDKKINSDTSSIEAQILEFFDILSIKHVLFIAINCTVLWQNNTENRSHKFLAIT
jgi:hypothetical protein